LDEMLDDSAADVGVRVHALKIDLDGGFHVYHRRFLPTKKVSWKRAPLIDMAQIIGRHRSIPRNVR
jgi:hypothetical protein